MKFDGVQYEVTLTLLDLFQYTVSAVVLKGRLNKYRTHDVAKDGIGWLRGA